MGIVGCVGISQSQVCLIQNTKGQTMSVEKTVNDILDELERELEQLERIREKIITIPIPKGSDVEGVKDD